MYIPRKIEDKLKLLLNHFPAIALLGPRQVGKTTLVKRIRDQLPKKSIYLDLENPVDAGALLVTDVDGNLEEDLNYQLSEIERVFRENGCSEFKIASDEQEAKDIWFARRNASPALSVYGSKKLNEDVTVPRAVLPELLEKFYAIAQKYDVKIPCFGHTGDGNVHTNVMVDGSDAEQVKIAEGVNVFIGLMFFS